MGATVPPSMTFETPTVGFSPCPVNGVDASPRSAPAPAEPVASPHPPSLASDESLR